MRHEHASRPSSLVGSPFPNVSARVGRIRVVNPLQILTLWNYAKTLRGFWNGGRNLRNQDAVSCANVVYRGRTL